MVLLQQTFGVFKNQLRYLRRHPCRLIFSALMIILINISFFLSSYSKFEASAKRPWERSDSYTESYAPYERSLETIGSTTKLWNFKGSNSFSPKDSVSISQNGEEVIASLTNYPMFYAGWNFPSGMPKLFATVAKYLANVDNFEITVESQLDENSPRSGFTSPRFLLFIFPSFGLVAMLVAGIFINFMMEDRKKKLQDGFALSGLRPFAYWTGNIAAFVLLTLVYSIVYSLLIMVSTSLPFGRALFILLTVWFTFISSLLLGSVIFNLMPDRDKIRRILYLLVHLLLPFLVGLFYTLFTTTFNKVLVTALAIFVPVFGMSLNISQVLGGYGLPLSAGIFYNAPSSETLILISLAQIIVLFGILNLLNFSVFKKVLTIANLKSKVAAKAIPDPGPLPKYPQESDPSNARLILAVNEITKVFPGKTSRPRALDRVSMNVYANEIFAIIGHNGSGKSTLLSILVGILKQTSGDFVLNAKNIGFCPQNDVLYDCLTVREHLLFMASIRCIPSHQVQSMITEISNELLLGPIMARQCKNLSGGEKRRVCIAMAFLGNPELVILDEPTGGMDPATRRNLWAFLSMKKATSSVILCTHYMDEADTLANRKAFLTEGQVKCIGSSAFFKTVFKCGYNVTVKYRKGHADGAKSVEKMLQQLKFGFELKKFDHEEGTKEFVINDSNISAVLKSLENFVSDVSSGVENFHIRENGLEKIFMDHEAFTTLADNDIAKSSIVSVSQPEADEGHANRIRDAMKEVDLARESGHHDALKFFKLLKFQILTAVGNWKEFILRLAFALAIFGVIFWFYKEVNFKSNSEPLDFDDAAVFEELLRGHKFRFHCSSQNYDVLGVSKFMIDNDRSDSVAATIKCLGTTKWEIIRHLPLDYDTVTLYGSYLIMKASGNKEFKWKIDSIANDVKDGANDVTKLLKIMIIVFLSSSIVDATVKDLLGVVISERATIKFLLFSFGINPWMFFLSTMVRNILYLLPFFATVYALYHEIVSKMMSLVVANSSVAIDPASGEFAGSFVLFLLACSFYIIGMAYLFECPERGKSAFAAISWMSFFACMLPSFLMGIDGGKTSISVMEYLSYILPLVSPNNQLVVQVFFGLFAIGRAASFNLLGISNAMYGALIGLVILIIAVMEFYYIFYKSSGGDPMIDPNYDGVVLNGVSKRVVSDLTMRLENNKITCLLGVNGAGKTTTMKMIMSQLFPSKGSIHVFGVNAHEERFKSLSMLGYCPQTDGLLIETLSVRDHLRFFSSLTISDVAVQDRIIMALADAFQFASYMNVRAMDLSGGTKRKISCAIAFLTPSKLVVLDEVTTGVDAAARQSLWEGLGGSRCSKSILVSTHYMREAGMSDSIAIMHKGQLFCQDSEFGLASKYGRGYNVTIKSNNVQHVKGWFYGSHAFPHGTPVAISQEYADTITFTLDSDGLSTSQIMHVMEEAQRNGILESFAINKVSIEDIFLKLSSPFSSV